MSKTRIPDGTYFLHPDGSCWQSAMYRDGQYQGGSSESLAASHAAAQDQYADVVPTEGDEEVDADVAEAIIREVMGPDTYLDMVVVERAAG